MKLLYLGDVIGKGGRDAVIERLPQLRRGLSLDFVVVNGENAAHGFGITPKICAQFYEAGADVITTGNHIWDRREIIGYIDGDPRLIRPMNYPEATPGRGVGVFDAGAGRRVCVMQVMGRLFMKPLDDPFRALEAALVRNPLGAAKGGVDAIIVDLHAEATSEKMALGHVSDGRASMAVGTHSHVPTADAHIMTGGTAYQTDLGMCGNYDSVIGMSKGPAVARFTNPLSGERLAPAEGEATVCGTLVETDDATGLAKRIQPLRLGGILQNQTPDF